jgi:hypothetical protein
MRVISKFPFLLGLMALLLLFLGVFLKPADDAFNPGLTVTGVVLAGIYWIWILVEISRATHLRYYQKMFWFIITISAPFFGAIIYQIMHQRRKKIVT